MSDTSHVLCKRTGLEQRKERMAMFGKKLRLQNEER